jgi:uncharacterized phage-associated protein
MGADYKKVVQALNYVARKCGARKAIHNLKAIKLLYLADRYHLRKYGRLLTDDCYLAMNYGPVGSLTRDLTGDSHFLDQEAGYYASLYVKPSGKHRFESIKRPDKTVFSQTDLEALDFAIEHFGHLGWNELAEFTHVFPEWKAHEKQANEKGAAIPMNVEDFFKDPPPDDALYKRYPSEAATFEDVHNPHMLDIVREWNEKARLWE